MENPDLGFPPAQHEWVGESCDIVSFIKVATHHAAISCNDRSQSTVFTDNLAFPHRFKLASHLRRKRKPPPLFLEQIL
jgi:hypothetical protein